MAGRREVGERAWRSGVAAYDAADSREHLEPHADYSEDAAGVVGVDGIEAAAGSDAAQVADNDVARADGGPPLRLPDWLVASASERLGAAPRLVGIPQSCS